MGPIEIYIFGDLDFAYFILNGITMMYANDSSFIKAAFVLSMLFLLWSFIKWSMNPEKNTYPIREWAFGLIFFMIFGGSSISPKVDIQLHSAISPGYFKSTITDVPILAAIPSWLSTNLFYSISKVINETGALNIPGYEQFRGNGITNKPDAEPLQALVRLYTFAETTTLPVNEERAIKDYLEQCYIPQLALSAEPQLKFEKTLLTQPLWPDFKVTNQHLTVNSVNFVDGTPIQGQKCTDNYQFIEKHINDETGKIRQSANSIVQSRGVNPDEIKFGFQMINTMLAGTETSPNPYTITTNMFLARTLKDTISQSPAAQTYSVWAQKMVFEGERKRTFDAAGEKALFEKIYIPTITAVETFSFYIAPILMILSILGGFGFAYIGKYLLLVLFINLWSFVRPFVDVFTALALSKAFNTDGSIDRKLDSYISISTYPQTASEIDAMLTMASNLTMAIPFLSMFLLYGGVHSMMGVMRTVTGGSTDSSNMAPTMATSMNAASFQQGDQTTSLTVSNAGFATTHQAGSNALFGQNQTQAGLSSVIGAAQASLKAEQNASAKSWNNTISSLKSDVKTALDSRQSGDALSSTDGASSQKLFSAINASANQYTKGLSSQAQVAANLMASAGADLALGGSGGSTKKTSDPKTKDDVTGKVDQFSTAKSRLINAGFSANLAASVLNGLSETDLESLNKTFTDSQQRATNLASQKGFNIEKSYQDLKGFNTQIAKNDSWAELHSLSEQRTNLDTRQQQLSKTLDQNSALTSANNLEFHRVAGFDIPKLTDFLNKSENEGLRNRISELWGVENSTGSIVSEVMKNAGGDPSKADGAFAAFQMLKSLNKNDPSLEVSSKDADFAAKLYTELSNYAGDYSTGFKEAAQISKDIANASTSIHKYGTNIDPANVNNALNASEKVENSNLKNLQPNDRTTDKEVKEQATADGLRQQNGSVTQQSGAGKTIDDLMTREQATEIGKSQKTQDDTRQALSPSMSFAQSLASTVGDFVELFRGRQALWGEQMGTIAPNLASFAAKQLHIQSGELSSGLTQMGTMDHSAIPQLFKNLESSNPQVANEAAQQISRLNDARMFASTKEGSSAILDALDEKTGKHFVQSMKLFEENLNKLDRDGLNAQTFNAISQSRMNGSMTDNQAYTALSLITGDTHSPIDQNSKFDYEPSKQLENDTKSLSWTLNNDDSTFKQSHNASIIRDAIKGNEIASNFINSFAPDTNSNDYRTEALKDFTLDSTQFASLAGRMLQDNTFVVGYNSQAEEFNRNQAPYKYITGVLSEGGDYQQVNKDLIQDSVKGGFFTSADALKDRQEQIFTIVASPIPHNERLENAGFVSEAGILNNAVSDLTQKAQDQYIAIPETKVDSDFLETQKISEQLPTASEYLKIK